MSSDFLLTNAAAAYRAKLREAGQHTPGGYPTKADIRAALRSTAREFGCTPEDLQKWMDQF